MRVKSTEKYQKTFELRKKETKRGKKGKKIVYKKSKREKFSPKKGKNAKIKRLRFSLGFIEIGPETNPNFLFLIDMLLLMLKSYRGEDLGFLDCKT